MRLGGHLGIRGTGEDHPWRLAAAQEWFKGTFGMTCDGGGARGMGTSFQRLKVSSANPGSLTASGSHAAVAAMSAAGARREIGGEKPVGTLAMVGRDGEDAESLPPCTKQPAHPCP